MQSSESDIELDTNEIVTSKTFVCTVRYYYDAEDNLVKKRIKFADGKEQNVLYEQAENDSQIVRFTAGGKTVTSHSKTDSFGRKVFDELQLGAGFVSRQFHYLEGEVTDEHKNNNMLKSTPTTQLVSQIVLSGNRTISYEYDEEERITKVIDSLEGVTEYTYDALGQLLTETKNGETVNQMFYDNYGNILQKNGIQYVYDEVWEDKLISYNSQPIIYDAQGNPTSYLGHTLTWEKGRQLKRFVNSDNTVISYTYNANGIRTSKTVGEIRHEYTLDGATILRETWDGNTLIPLYDNEDSVCGIEYNGTAYYFLKNLQGDVIAITDNTGKDIARYYYDAWGVCTIVKDVSACGIANINPFRYRGYYLDKETGLYYLNSRYYDANTGRFINADSPEYVSIQGGNLFAYCGNCPTKNADYFGFCYVPTYPETYIPSYSSPSYSYGKKKKKEDGLLETLLKVIGGIIGIAGLFIANILLDIRNFLKENPWIQDVVSWILIALLLIAIFVSASWLTVALGIFAAINTFINIVTFEFSIEDILSTIVSRGINSVIKEFIKNKKVLEAVKALVEKVVGYFIKMRI